MYRETEFVREIERLSALVRVLDKAYQDARGAYMVGRCSEVDLSYAYTMRRKSISDLHAVVSEYKAVMRTRNREDEFKRNARIWRILDDAISGRGEDGSNDHLRHGGSEVDGLGRNDVHPLTA